VKSTLHVACLKNFLRMLMLQQSWILSKKPFLPSCVVLFVFKLAIIALFLLFNHLLVIYFLRNNQCEWHWIALLCWCAVKKLLTHSLMSLQTNFLECLLNRWTSWCQSELFEWLDFSLSWMLCQFDAWPSECLSVSDYEVRTTSENVDATTIMDFIKETSFYHLV